MFGDFDISTFCSGTGSVLQFVGYIITIIKIAMPILIIVFGILDLGKAVVSSKEDEIKTSAKKLMWRIVAGIFIFFIPSIVIWIFGEISEYKDASAGFDNCKNCLLHPWDGCKTNGN